MECVATRDIDNPHWDDLLEHVKQLNDQLLALAHFYLGKKKLLTDDDVLPTATSSIADACLEVTDATCVVMATMRSIIHNHVAVPQGQNRDTDDKSVETSKHTFSPEGKMQRVMTIMEVALSLSKSKNEEDLVHVLEQAMSMMKRLSSEMNESTPNERTNKRTRTTQLT